MINTVNNIGTQVNFVLRANSLWNQKLKFTDSAGAPIMLSNYSEIQCQARIKPESPVILDIKLTEGGFTITNVNELNINSIPIPDVENCPKTYKYDIFFLGPGVKDCLLYGTITIIDSITE
jgi:hypothetical protein